MPSWMPLWWIRLFKKCLTEPSRVWGARMNASLLSPHWCPTTYSRCPFYPCLPLTLKHPESATATGVSVCPDLPAVCSFQLLMFPRLKAHAPLPPAPHLYRLEPSNSTGCPHICGQSRTISLEPQDRPGWGVGQLCSPAVICVTHLHRLSG